MYTKYQFCVCYFTIGVLCLIIGFPIWMSGCNKYFGGPCVRYTPYDATVTSNECYITHGDHYGDDVIGCNCNVHVKYVSKQVPITCNIYRSDQDECGDLVQSYSQLKKCNILNTQDYPLNKNITIYVSSTGTCYSSHYVKRLSIIGTIFLIVGFGFIIITGLYIKIKMFYTSHDSYRLLQNINGVATENHL